ncbi:MAG: ammonium transporter, partial [Fimbriiglobus sp.]
AEADKKLSAEEKTQAESASTDEEKAKLSDDQKTYKTLKGVSDNGPMAQPIIQIKAALFSAVYAFVASLLLCVLVQAITLGNFSTSKKDETIGLDQTEHGEAGFDFGYASQSLTATSSEPRAASLPKGDGRFELHIEGATSGDLVKVWSSLCQPTGQPADADFLAVYPYVTTVRGTTFRCRGGNKDAIAKRLDALFKKHLPGRPVKVTTV